MLTPEMVSRAVRETAPLSGREVTTALDEICRAEMKAGRDADELREAMIASWRDFDMNKPKFSCIWGAAKFFGEGMWKNKPGWPWKTGSEPAPPRKFVNAADKARAQLRDGDDTAERAARDAAMSQGGAIGRVARSMDRWDRIGAERIAENKINATSPAL
jgi:hypothetical protein